jgi:hypothetical protein
MKIILEHPFKYRSHNLPGLLNNCKKLSTYCNRLERQCNLHPDRYSPENYLGDGFEYFVEALIKLNPVNSQIGIGDYKVIAKSDDLDTGVDGVGIGIDGKAATVQVKYRTPDHLLTANVDRLTNFTSTSFMKYGVDPQTKTNLLIVTTAKDLHHFTKDEMFLGRVRVIGYEKLRDLVDNNKLFWDKFRELSGIKNEQK